MSKRLIAGLQLDKKGESSKQAAMDLPQRMFGPISLPDRPLSRQHSPKALSNRKAAATSSSQRKLPHKLGRDMSLLELLLPVPQHRDADVEQAEEEFFVKELNSMFNLERPVTLKDKSSRFTGNPTALIFGPNSRENTLMLIQRAEHLVAKKDYLHLVLSYPIQPEPEGIARFQYFSRIFFHLNRQIREQNSSRGNLRILIGTRIREEVLEVLEKSLAKYDFHLAAYLPGQVRGNPDDQRSLTQKIEAGLMRLQSNVTIQAPEETWRMAVKFATRQVSQCIEEDRGCRKIGVSGFRSDEVAGALKDVANCHVVFYDSASIHQTKKKITNYIAQHVNGAADKFLLLVDSGDKKIDLFELKIPDHGFLVLTTLSQNVYEMMEIDVGIRMEDHLLPWELFCRTAGYRLVYSSPSIKERAIILVKECNGHLLAIALLATALRHAPDTWELAINSMASWHSQQVEGTSWVMVCAMEMIWHQQDIIAKHCLVAWASLSFPKAKYEMIADLVKKGFVKKDDEGESILRDALSFSLLEEVNQGSHVAMRLETKIVLRNYFAKCLPSLPMNKGGLGLKETPEEELWNTQAIYLHKNKLSKLPLEPECPRLKTLFLHENNFLMKIPELFFQNMPLLQKLDLSYTSIKCLPPSVSKLVSLRIFYLRCCKLLMELPPQIGALLNLEEFDLEGTELRYLPKEIGDLSRLTHFKVSFCACSSPIKRTNGQIQRTVPEKVFSNFSQMSELSIDLSPDGDWSEVDVQAILNELRSLKKLKIIQLYLPSDKLLQQLRWNGVKLMYSDLSRFRFTVGSHRQRIISRLPGEILTNFKNWETSGNCLKYINGESVSDGITEAVKHTNILFLDRHWTIKELSEFGTTNMINLKYCLLVECNELEAIIARDRQSSTGVADEPALGSLRYLGIHYMKNFEKICRGPTQKDSLSKLIFLHLHACPNLVMVFSPSLCANLLRLESLIVEDCPRINSLITEETPILSGCFLRNLKHVSLIHLPELNSISGGLCRLPALKTLLVYDCPKLETILAADLSSSSVKIIGEKSWLNTRSWPKDCRWPMCEELRSGEGLMNRIAELIYPRSMVI